MHYTRWRRYGDPTVKVRKGGTRGPTAERFWNLVEKRGPDDCWLWTLQPMQSGYGRFKPGPGLESIYAHRMAHTLAIGPIPEGHEVHHTCDNRFCMNPAHLRAMTVAEHRALGQGHTHCRYGHEYTVANTYVNPKGVKVCRTCMRTRYKRR